MQKNVCFYVLSLDRPFAVENNGFFWPVISGLITLFPTHSSRFNDGFYIRFKTSFSPRLSLAAAASFLCFSLSTVESTVELLAVFF